RCALARIIPLLLMPTAFKTCHCLSAKRKLRSFISQRSRFRCHNTPDDMMVVPSVLTQRDFPTICPLSLRAKASLLPDGTPGSVPNDPRSVGDSSSLDQNTPWWLLGFPPELI